ncbi:MAG TPA: lipopolysaccharide biosynthesis protein RfbH [Gemmatimonadaceae bacterium]
MTSDDVRRRILELVAEFQDTRRGEEARFVAGETPIPVSGRVYDADDVRELVDASLDFWLTTGRFAAQFERDFARFMGVRSASLCNSGSSANLLALSALTSPKLEDRQLRPGDEVITAAAGFPTTINPIIQNGLVPVFVDVELGTYDATAARIEEAIGPRTRAVMLAHTLGNPFDAPALRALADRHGLWLVEDCCDAVGSTIAGQGVGTFGELATVSFYPAHHMTMGEGGAVLTRRPDLRVIVESFRDWGRDCWCEPGRENTCGKRFDWQLGELPRGYDHKYIYSHVGYNLKVTDMQAAVGVAQLRKLPSFIAARRRNWQLLRSGLEQLEEFFVLPEPTTGSDPSWFGFALTVRESAPFTRPELIRWLEDRRIATRLLFGGNLVRQPAYQNIPSRPVGDLSNSDRVMHGTFWLGVYPGITDEMAAFMIDSITGFVRKRTAAGAASV